jgi:iron complex outermembrane receptor protein
VSRRRSASVAIALLCLIPVGVLSAQAGTGSIRGVVKDSATGRPVAEARVQLMGTQWYALTSPSGEFRVPGIANGIYSLRVVAVGYGSVERDGIDVEGSEETITLALARRAVDLPGIVVTAGTGSDRAGEGSVSVAVVGRDELRRRDVTTLDAELPFVPGVAINHSTLDIRGASGLDEGVGSRVLLMLDGHPLLTPDGGQINFYAIPLLDVDRVEVVKGAYSALYGSAALGGVINMLTTPVEAEPKTMARGYAGAYDTPAQDRFTPDERHYAGLELQHSRQIGGAGVRLAGGGETSDGFTQNGDLNRYYARVKLTSAAGSAHPWDAFVVAALNKQGDFFIARSLDHLFEVDSNELGNRTKDGQVLAGATFTPLSRQSSSLRLSPTLLFAGSRNFFSDNHDWHNAVRAGLNVRYQANLPGRNTLTLGADGNYTVVRSNFIGRPDITDLSLFSFDEWRLAARWRATLGLRYDWHDTNVGEAEHSLSPTAGLVWTTTPWLNTRASISHGYRAPSATEQFVSTVQSGFHVVPNDSLRGETGWSGEVGATATAGRLSFDGAAFQSNYRGFIGPGGVPGQFGYFQFQNISSARVRGLDLSSRLAVWPGRIDLAASYLLLDSHSGAPGGGPLPYRSRHSVTGSVDILSGLAGVDVRWRSRIEEVLAYPADPRSAITVVDLRLAYRVFGAVVMAKVTNLLQTRYVDIMERTPGAPRTVEMSLVVGH